MRIVNNIKNFLYDKDYFINIFENKIHIFNYVDLKELNELKIILTMQDFSLEIKGNELHVIKMAPSELMIKGEIISLEFKND